MGAPRAVALCQSFNGALEYRAGHWDESEASLRESIQLYREMGAASGEAIVCQRMGELLTARGQLSEGLAMLQEGLTIAEISIARAHNRVRLYATLAHNRLVADDIPAADQALAQGLVLSERHGNCTTCNALLLPAAVSVRIAQGDFAGAKAFCQQLDETAEAYASRVWVAMARQSRGELAAAENDLDNALGFYAEAHKAYTAAGNEYEAARCLAAMATVRRARDAAGDADKGQAEQAEAQQTFARLSVA